jgi:hypothetical protein
MRMSGEIRDIRRDSEGGVGASAGVENDVSPTGSLDHTWANFFVTACLRMMMMMADGLLL